MSKTKKKVPYRNLAVLAMIAEGKGGTIIMRDRRERRAKDARRNPLREEW